MQKLRKNDEVIVISGKHKGQSGRIIKINYPKNRAVVEKINVVKKHRKPSQVNSEGGIFEQESTIDLSNIALASKGKDKKPLKVKFVVSNNKKIRVDKKTGKVV